MHTLEGIPLVGLRPTRLVALVAGAEARVRPRGSGSRAALPRAAVRSVVAVAIKLESRGPVFFRQVRRGANGTTFRIYKFRTMVAEAEERKADVVAPQHAPRAATRG